MNIRLLLSSSEQKRVLDRGSSLRVPAHLDGHYGVIAIGSKVHDAFCTGAHGKVERVGNAIYQACSDAVARPKSVSRIWHELPHSIHLPPLAPLFANQAQS